MNVVKYLYDKKFFGDLGQFNKTIKPDFYNYGIRVSYAIDEKTGYKRFIFSSTKKFREGSRGLIDKYVSECNGLILGIATVEPLAEPAEGSVKPSTEPAKTVSNPKWEILASPPGTFISNVPERTITHNMSKDLYDIFLINEGTIVTLYYFQGEWIMASTNGIDVREVEWDGVSYQRAFDEALVQTMSAPDAGTTLHKSFTKDMFYNSLKKDHCYTFGFKHPERHPFYEGKDKPVYNFWFVSAGDSNSGIKFYTQHTAEDPAGAGGVYNEITVDGKKNKILYYTQKQFRADDIEKKSSDKILTCRDLFNICASSMDNFRNKKHVTYGFILRSRDPSKTIGYSDILLESTLLKHIRRLYYQGSFIFNAKSCSMPRKDYVLIHSFLHDETSKKFLEMFPQHKHTFKFYTRLVNSLVNATLDLYKADVKKKSRSRSSSTSSTSSTPTFTPTSAPSTPAPALTSTLASKSKDTLSVSGSENEETKTINAFAKAVRSLIDKKITIKYNETTKKYITDFIMNPVYMTVIYKLMLVHNKHHPPTGFRITL